MKTQMMLLFALLTSSLAQAGGVGNGGIAYVCRDPENKKITYARLLDLWEPSSFTPSRNFLEKNSNLNRALKLMQEYFPHGAETLKSEIQTLKTEVLKTSRKLQLTNDALPAYVPEKNCDYEQVARYGFDYELRKNVLKINQEIFESPQFSATDIDALFFHEALYKIAIENWHVTDSRFIRSIVAVHFSSAFSTGSEINSELRYSAAQLFTKKHCSVEAHNNEWIQLTDDSECKSLIFPTRSLSPVIRIEAELIYKVTDDMKNSVAPHYWTSTQTLSHNLGSVYCHEFSKELHSKYKSSCTLIADLLPFDTTPERQQSSQLNLQFFQSNIPMNERPRPVYFSMSVQNPNPTLPALFTKNIVTRVNSVIRFYPVMVDSMDTLIETQFRLIKMINP